MGSLGLLASPDSNSHKPETHLLNGPTQLVCYPFIDKLQTLCKFYRIRGEKLEEKTVY